MGVRRRGRELALQMLYQHELAGTSLAEMASRFEDLALAPPQAREFALALVQGVLEHLAEIDRHVSQQAEHWRIERMAAVDRNILRLALYELLYAPDTPPAVVIDEAVELAKRYGSEHSGPFVNGVLDGFLHRQASSVGS
jgi:N utilization substance protein B